VWKNQPCEDKAIQTLPSVEKQKERPTKTPEHMTKKFIVHKFITYAYDQKNKYNIDYPVRFVENFCLAEATSFEDCQKEIEKHTKKIKEELDLTEKSKKEVTNNVNNNATKVVVIQNNLFGLPSTSPNPTLINRDVQGRREGPFVGYRSNK
jgi:hypothetical protein